ncbi:hypothetical protein LJC29_07855 [Bacteroides sp. OttesenSCG-928-N06]|nr:hypothetical protein [Bacteroides sp. OttesenSCG-928-N06]
MKLKFLSLIVAGLAFTACSQDDDFVINKAEQGDFSPITFTVNYDDATRSHWSGGNLYFDPDDRVSFFNNLTINASKPRNGAFSVGAHSPFTYSKSGDEGYSFQSPNADIIEGSAVLVWPADLEQAWRDAKSDAMGNSLSVSIKTEQPLGYHKELPYATDIFKVDPYGSDGKDNSAGVERNYETIFKPIGTLVNLTLVPNKEQYEAFSKLVPNFGFESVTLNAGSTEGQFVTKVAYGAKVATGTTTTYEDSKLKTYKDGKYAHYQYSLDATHILEKSQKLTTKDIDKDNVARFVLLPSVKDDAFTGASITIKTTKGSFTVSNKSSLKPIVRPVEVDGKTNKWTLLDAFNEWADFSWGADPNFNNVEGGGVISLNFEFDLSSLSLNLNVENSKQLLELMAMHEALGKTTTTLKPALVGEGGQFVLTQEALNALADAKYKIELSAKCEAIVMGLDKDGKEEGGNSATMEQFAELTFKATNLPTNLELRGDWTLTTAANFGNIKRSIINWGNLELTNEGGEIFPGDKLFINKARATLTIPSGIVNMGKTFAAAGSIIEIADGASYYSKAKTELFGTVTIGASSTLKSDGGTNDRIINYGTIENSGKIIATPGSTYINNGGVIKNMVADTEIVIQANTVAAGVGNESTGIIELYAMNDRLTINNADAGVQGYIKYAYKAGDVITGSANFLVVDVTGAFDITDLPAGIKYLQLEGGITELINKTDGGSALTTIFCNVAGHVQYPVDNTVLKVVNLYVNTLFTAYNRNVVVTGYWSNGKKVDYISGNYLKEGNRSYNGAFIDQTITAP